MDTPTPNTVLSPLSKRERKISRHDYGFTWDQGGPGKDCDVEVGPARQANAGLRGSAGSLGLSPTGQGSGQIPQSRATTERKVGLVGFIARGLMWVEVGTLLKKSGQLSFTGPRWKSVGRTVRGPVRHLGEKRVKRRKKTAGSRGTGSPMCSPGLVVLLAPKSWLYKDLVVAPHCSL